MKILRWMIDYLRIDGRRAADERLAQALELFDEHIRALRAVAEAERKLIPHAEPPHSASTASCI